MQERQNLRQVFQRDDLPPVAESLEAARRTITEVLFNLNRRIVDSLQSEINGLESGVGKYQSMFQTLLRTK